MVLPRLVCDMKTTLFKKTALCTALLIPAAVGVAVAQTADPQPVKKVNFGYSQNPKTRAKIQNQTETTENAEPQPEKVENNVSNNESIARKTLEVVRNANNKSLPPTENYKVGVGDILFINLQNSSKGSSYYTVLNDGTIDYPLAGEMIPVAGMTTEEIEDTLRSRVKLYENPSISVKVRDYASHKITVLGLVEKTGEKFIQREAVPLFVIRAEAIVKPEANRVTVRRADSSVENFSLRDEKSENTLIFPNDIVEFASDGASAAKNGRLRFFFIGGEVVAGGQKDFYDGMTLTQAILASGGLRKEGVKKVVIRRKNTEGLLVSNEFNLKQIKDGKIPDPRLEAGDTIEIGN